MKLKEQDLTGKIIAAAIEVHRILGPGLLESIYEECLCYEFELIPLLYERQVPIPLVYKGKQLGELYRIDLLVEKKVIVELKVVEKLLPIHEAQLLTYMKLANISVGLLLNFNEAILKNGIVRRVL
jgi:GxxExxY protein